MLSVFYGAKEIRTPDPHAASVVLYQLSYSPIGRRCNNRQPPEEVQDEMGRVRGIFHPWDLSVSSIQDMAD